MVLKNGVSEGSRKATKAAKSLGIFSEDQLASYGGDISFLLGIDVSSSKRGKKGKGKYGGHESYGHDDSTKESLKL
jgi:hypothetical protein